MILKKARLIRCVALSAAAAMSSPFLLTDEPAVRVVPAPETYAPAVKSGTIDIPALAELSGLAASRLRDDVLWAHNDSGNDPILFAIGTDGRNLGTFRVEGATHVDWEDIASFEKDGVSYLVIGDVGDNEAVRPEVRLIFVREPSLRGDGPPEHGVLAVAWSVPFRYEDGPRDCESVAVDADGGRILLMSKRVVPAAVYSIPIRPPEGNAVTATKVAEAVKIPQPDDAGLGRNLLGRYASQPTGMDISPDGTRVIVQTYTEGWLFRREPGASWRQVFAAEPERIRVPRMRQVEAVAFGRAGRSLFVSGEFRPSPLFRLEPEPAMEPVTRIGGIDLVWHWEGAGASGEHAADEPINPASVVKLATTLWALEILGPEHRFRTAVSALGKIDSTGALHGDLVVHGDGDPDFHVENAQLLAHALRDLGIRRVEGELLVNDAFWIGWENGSELPDPKRRAKKMARRLADAWDPRTWRPETLRAMRKLRNHRPQTEFIHLPVGGVGRFGGRGDRGVPVVEHMSNPLRITLKRFNAFSNNDIERLGHRLGDPDALTAFYRQRWGDPQPAVRFETLSGLGSNRMSPRQVTRLVRELSATAKRHEMELTDLLPALGCGRNTLQGYRGLLDGLPVAGVVGKTGTLVRTDGGVITLAGEIRTDAGNVVFFVGAPRNGARMNAARRAQTRWLLERSARWTVLGATCEESTAYSYQQVDVQLLGALGVAPVGRVDTDDLVLLDE